MKINIHISYLLDLFNVNEKRGLKIFFVLMLLSSLLEVLGLGLLIPLMQLITAPNNEIVFINHVSNFLSIPIDNVFIFLILIFLVFQIFKILYLTLYSYLEHRFIYNFKKRIKKKLLIKYLDQEFDIFFLKNSSVLLRNINEGVDMVTVFLFSFLKCLLEILMLIFIFVFLLIYNTQLTLTVTCLLLLISFLYILACKDKLTAFGSMRQYLYGKKIQYFQECIENYKWIKISRSENFFKEKFNLKNAKLAKISIISAFIQGLPRYFLELFAILFLTSILFYYYEIANYSLNYILEVLAIFLAATFKLIPSISRFLSGYQSMKNTFPELKNISNEFAKKNFKKSENDKKAELNFNREIMININNFTYDENTKINLNASFKVKKGEKIGIIGESGSGKSTMLDIILGLIKTDRNSILVDGKSIYDNLYGWYDLIGYVPQQITIIEDTIKNNILFGKEDNEINQQKIEELINTMNLTSFINSKKEGLNRIISEKASNISGGEVQRIAICRALLHDPEIIIFDEATSSLDPTNESKILDTIKKFDEKTMFFVSHKRSSLTYCDKVYELKDNKLTLKIHEKFQK